jgi:hypothetical protein
LILGLAIVYVGALGVVSADYGYHWDEKRLVASVRESASTGLLLPRWYEYPSLCFDICLLAAAAEVGVAYVRGGDLRGAVESGAVKEFLASEAYFIRLRRVFFLLSILSCIPVYVVASRVSGSRWIGAFAGVASISTWEFAYHARWVVTDCILALFISWSLMASFKTLNAESPRARLAWLSLSSILAGLCIGAKYPGGIVLVPLVLALLGAPRTPSDVPIACIVAASLALAALTFVFTTPGILAEPYRFISGVNASISLYARGHGGYTVESTWDHLLKLGMYLGSVFLSKNPVLAIVGSALSVWGAAHMVRSNRGLAAWFLALPVLYVALMASQKVMIVRNYQLLIPYMAILMALGLGTASAAVPANWQRHARVVVFAAGAGFLLYNLVAVSTASVGILRPHGVSQATALDHWLRSAPEKRFFLSPGARLLLRAEFRNTVDDINLANEVIFSSEEIRDWRLFPANVPGRYKTVWSPVEEVNWDYYPSWRGNARLLAISPNRPEFSGIGFVLSRAEGEAR